MAVRLDLGVHGCVCVKVLTCFLLMTTEVDNSIDAIVTTVSRAFYETNVRSARLYGARVTY